MFDALLRETVRISEGEIEYVKLSELLPCPYNRKIDRDKVDNIKDAIKSTGEVKPFVVTEVNSEDGKTLMITDGHHRHIALKELIADGEYDADSKVPVVMADEKGVETAKDEKPQEVKEAINEEYRLEKRTYEIEADPETLEKLDELFAALQACNCGMSRGITFGHDGDGAATLKVLNRDLELSKEQYEALENDNLTV